MKKRLILVIALLCMASLMAAMAYTTAYVKNDASFKVSNTSEALLAITAGNHAAADYTEGGTSNELVINWARGNGGEFGVQSGSVYIWDKLFMVTNNSENIVKVSITVPSDSAKPEPNIGSKVYFKTECANDWTALASRHTGAYNNEITFTLSPSESMKIDSKIDSMQRTLAKGKKEFRLEVNAERVEQ